jgi:hypothetical protein
MSTLTQISPSASPINKPITWSWRIIGEDMPGVTQWKAIDLRKAL